MLRRRPRWSSRSPDQLVGRARIAAGLVALSLAAPGAALAAGATVTAGQAPAIPLPGATNPLSPGLPASPTPAPTQSTPTVTAQTTTTPGSSGLSGGAAIGIAIGAIVLLTGISFFIWRDARRRAPVRDRAGLAPGAPGSRQGSKQRVKPRKLSAQERKRRKRGRAR
jgi:hypothetical protein